MVTGDIDELDQTYADDWAPVDAVGKRSIKQSLLSDLRSCTHKLLGSRINLWTRRCSAVWP